MNNNEKHNTTALITGASSGIGAQLAKELAAHGHNVVLLARRTDRLEQLAEHLENTHAVKAVVLTADLSERGAPERVYAELRKRQVQVDILVNNAGFNVYGSFLETHQEDEVAMLQVNLLALVALTKLFVRDMASRHFGRILNLGSTGSFAPAPFDSLYAAGKAFVLSFSEALAEELKDTGVTVTALCPGPVRTEFAAVAGMSGTKIFGGKLLGAQEVASAGYAAMMKGRRTVVVGLANKLQVWGMRLTPRLLVTKIARGLMSSTARVQPGAHQPGY